MISGNADDGIEISGADAGGNRVAGNYIGTNATADAGLGNGVAGVLITSPILRENGNVVGGGGASSGNIISGNGANGVLISGGGGNEVSGNYIGTDGTGSSAIPNAQSGVEVEFSFLSEIGGFDPSQRNVISGNLGNGISVIRSASGTFIEGNYIGTDASGTAAIPNDVGVFVGEAGQNFIGREQFPRNVISGNHRAGVRLFGDSETYIQNNFIGTVADGTEALPNEYGVEIQGFGGFGNTRIGGTAGGLGNVISGNSSFGIAAFDARGITVQGNWIGTDVSGMLAVPNGQSGVLIEKGESNFIGGDQPGAGNLISGNGQSGITIFDSQRDMVQGNLIGTDALGASTLSNGYAGVHVHSSGELTSGTLIGGKSGGSGNLISGNDIGVLIKGALANSIEGNRIGTDAAGTQALSNQIGVVVASDYNTIGGIEPGARNVISGNVQQGIYMDAVLGDASSNVVQGNYIGTDSSGSAPLPNDNGIEIAGVHENVIGGLEPGARNVISGNRFAGIAIENGAMFNTVQGNYIGTDQSGDSELGNGIAGILLEQAAENLIGGTNTGARNVISGNREGIQINGGAGGNMIQGNLVGTDASGTATILSGDGVRIIHSPSNLIGGTTPGARNVLSGGFDDGVEIQGDQATNNRIEGNFIGTDITGTIALGNAVSGVRVGSPGNVIGGANSGAGNLISGNYSGILLEPGTNTLVQGNLIGTDVTGSLPLGNSYEGVSIYNGPNNTIGGVAAGEPNVIAFNGENGVGVHEPGATGNTIRGNSIHSNGLKGIETINGGNNELPPAVITSAGSASGTACAGCTIDVYSDSEDEGRVYHGSTVADEGGNWSFAGAVVGPNVTATATEADGTTSEFSAPFACLDNDADVTCNSGDADDDNDGFSDTVEASAGTNSFASCGVDAWPADVNNDGYSDIQDVMYLTRAFGQSVPPAQARFDIAPDPPDGVIDIMDIIRMVARFGEGCPRP